jgi:hypothetical protein
MPLVYADAEPVIPQTVSRSHLLLASANYAIVSRQQHVQEIDYTRKHTDRTYNTVA